MMTVGLFERFVGEMDALREQRVLDMARAATAPHRDQAWWDSLVARAQGALVEAGQTAARASGFTFNGMAVSFDALRSKLSAAIGDGVSH